MSTMRKSPSKGPGSPDVWGFYEPDTGSIQYVAACPATRKAAVIDPVWNFDHVHARTSTQSADEIFRFVQSEGLDVEWVLDTHPHADHFTAGAILAERFRVPHAIGKRVEQVAQLWREFYNEPDAFNAEAEYDRLFEEGETFRIGELPVKVMLSTGHTLASITYVVGEDAAFVHDTLMVPDSGTSRADFPGGSAEELWDSIQAILALGDDTRLFVGHDYCKGGREPQWEATVAEHKASNIHVAEGATKADFVKTRTDRDETLPLPDRMLYCLQVNLRGGRLPPVEGDGRSYFKVPANRF
jgi:glyoxylase-like metal-dependent hydrolase (beta-lactamase superfamily II)